MSTGKKLTTNAGAPVTGSYRADLVGLPVPGDVPRNEAATIDPALADATECMPLTCIKDRARCASDTYPPKPGRSAWQIEELEVVDWYQQRADRSRNSISRSQCGQPTR